MIFPGLADDWWQCYGKLGNRMTAFLALRTRATISKSRLKCCGSSVVEHTLGKGEVGSSILPHSTMKTPIIIDNPYFLAIPFAKRQ